MHQSSMFKVVDVLCAVSYKVAEYDWIFPLCYGVFPVSWSTPCSSSSDPWCYLQTPCVSANYFSVYYGFSTVIYSWSFVQIVYQSSMFRVVDVL